MPATLSPPPPPTDITDSHGPQQIAPFLLDTLPSRRECRLAWIFIGLSSLFFVGAALFAQVRLPAKPAFIGMYQTAMAINDLVTAVLLLGMCFVRRSLPLLVLGCGYLFTSILATVHMLTFPGLLSESGLLGAGPQTTAWLYMIWHAGFPLCVIAYCQLENTRASALPPLLLPAAIGAVPLLALGAILLTTLGSARLPAIMAGNGYTDSMRLAIGSVCLTTLVALGLAWRQHRRSKLSLWLLVVMWAWLLDISLSALLNAGRFDLGFYAGRLYGLLSSSILLGALLVNALRDHVTMLAAQREIRRQGEEIADLYHNAPCGYHSLDENGIVQAINDTELRMLGYRREELIGRVHIRDLLSPASQATFDLNFPAFLHSGAVHDLDLELRGKDGRYLPVLVSANLVGTPGTPALRTRSVVVNNKERKEAEQALLSAKEDLELRIAERTRQLRQLASDATLAEEGERRAIARDLHDDIGQLIHVARMKLEAMGRSHDSDARQNLALQLDLALSDASTRIRSLTSQLSPPVLDRLGLVPALAWLASEMERTYDLTVEAIDDGQPKPLNASQAAILFRATRELLINVLKHARALFAIVETRLDDGHLILQVSDQGAGMAHLETALSGSTGFGLISIRERVTHLGGSLHIQSAPDQGTIVTITLPCPQHAHHGNPQP